MKIGDLVDMATKTCPAVPAKFNDSLVSLQKLQKHKKHYML